MISHPRSIAAILTIALLAACSGGTGNLTPAGSTGQTGQNGASKAGMLKLAIHVPAGTHASVVHGAHRAPHYISASTAGLTINISGPKTLDETFSLEPGASNCTSGTSGTTCTESIVLKPGTYTGAISTYDAVSCSGSTCTIPGTANELSSNQDVSFKVVAGQANTIGIALDGVVASVVLVPGSSSSLSGNASSGYTISKCLASESDHIYAADADGNYILGSGAPTISVTSSSSALAVSSPSPTSPNTFTFSGVFVKGTPSNHNTIPSAGSSVKLTAAFTPASGGGGSSVSYKATVTFDHTICGVLTEFPIITSAAYDWPRAIVTGPDGNLWFTESNSSDSGTGDGYIGKITTAGAVTVYSAGILADTYGITVGSDGNLWFTTAAGSSGSIGKITTAGVAKDPNNYPYDQTSPHGIVTGPDNKLWIANNYPGGEIDTMAASTSASPSPYTIEPSPQPSAYPREITSGPDGNLWFTDYNNRIWKVTTGGSFTPYSISTANANPQGIVSGPDGRVWFTEAGCPFVDGTCTPVDKIGAITTSGAITEYSSGITSPGEPWDITVGPDGNLWFTEYVGQRIAKMTTAGVITEYPLTLSSGDPAAITTGPDGSIWFTEDGIDEVAQGNLIGRLQ